MRNLILFNHHLLFLFPENCLKWSFWIGILFSISFAHDIHIVLICWTFSRRSRGRIVTWFKQKTHTRVLLLFPSCALVSQSLLFFINKVFLFVFCYDQGNWIVEMKTYWQPFDVELLSDSCFAILFDVVDEGVEN